MKSMEATLLSGLTLVELWNPFTTNGGIGSVQFNFLNHLGLVAEFGGYHSGNVSIYMDRKLDQTEFSYLFGPRVFFNKHGMVSPFIHFLAGGMHNSRSFAIPNGDLPVPLPPLPPGITVSPGAASTRFRTTQNAFAMAVGAGVDLRAGRHFAIRPVWNWITCPLTSPLSSIPGLGTVNSTRWQQNLRYSAGLDFLLGVPNPVPPKVTCSITPAEVMPWEGPVSATVQPADFNPKHTLAYNWTSSGATIQGEGATAKVDPANLSSGNYTLTATVNDPKAHKLNSASCTASFIVKQPRPPVINCSASPSSIQAGQSATITAVATSPDHQKLQPGKFSTASGTLGEQAATGAETVTSIAMLDTSGVQPGPVNVTVDVADVHGLKSSCVAIVAVGAVPAPVTPPKGIRVGECEFKNERKRARIDNECKAILDDVALRLQQNPEDHLVIVGYASEKDISAVPLVDVYRAYNAKKYLIAGEAKQSIDPSRIEVRKGAARDQGESR